MAWDKTEPIGTRSLKTSDEMIRENWLRLEEALEREHVFPGTIGGSGTSALHKEGSARVFIEASPTLANLSNGVATSTGMICLDTDTGIVHLCTDGANDTWVNAATFLSSGAGTPAAVDGLFIGQRYFDTTNVGWWTCTGTGSPGTWAPDIAPKSIQMFAGDPTADIPAGWLLCDGSSGTPDLSGRFIVGYDSGDADYDGTDPIGAPETGGNKVAELLAHTHDIRVNKHPSGDIAHNDNFVAGTVSTATTEGDAPAKGLSAGQADPDNRPPWYVLAYMIKKPVA